MRIRNPFLRCVLLLVVGTTSSVGVGGPARATIPMPDHVARVPLVGLLPRWTWDPLSRPDPTRPAERDPGAERASAFVVDALADEAPAGVDVVATYRLDGSGLYAVEVETSGGARASFTVELLDRGAEPSARLVGVER